MKHKGIFFRKLRPFSRVAFCWRNEIIRIRNSIRDVIEIQNLGICYVVILYVYVLYRIAILHAVCANKMLT